MLRIKFAGWGVGGEGKEEKREVEARGGEIKDANDNDDDDD